MRSAKAASRNDDALSRGGMGVNADYAARSPYLGLNVSVDELQEF